MADRRYHVRLRDDASGESLGLMLVDRGQLGYRRQLVNPYAAKVSQGETTDSDLSEWSLVSFRDWRGGRGQEEMEALDRYYDAGGVETRIEGQVTLGPLSHVPDGTVPQYVPGDVTERLVGYVQGFGQFAYSYPRVVGGGAQYAQRWVAPWQALYGLLSLNSIRIHVYKYSGVTDPLTVSIYSDLAGQPDTLLASVDVPAASVPTSTADWVEATLSTPLVISGNTWYHLVVSSAAGTYALSFTETIQYRPVLQGAPGDWDYVVHRTMTYEVKWAPVDLAQSFVGPTGGITATRARLWLRRVGLPGAFTFKLCSDSGGSPGSVLQTASIDGDLAPSEGGWVEVTFSSQALAAGTTYWLVLEDPGTARPAMLLWGADAGAGYASGSAKYRLGSGSWATLSGFDLYFQVEANELDGDVVAFARYNDKWYCGAGDTVYEWNNTTGKWDSSEERSGKNVTAMAVWDGKLWVARGTADNVRTYNGTAWAEASGPVTAQLLYAGGPVGGWLHRTNPTAGSTNVFYYTADGTTWSSAYEVGSSDYGITGMTWYNDMLVIATSVGLFGFAAEIVYQLLDWSSQEDADNGKGMLMWGRTGALYIPLRYGLYRWNGDTMVAIGPETGTGLPAGRVGKIAKLAGTNNWLFAAVDGQGTAISSVLAYNGMGGWHEVVRGDENLERIRALGFETVHSPSRLWYSLGDETRYCKLPDYSDNPYQWTGFEYVASGELITSWIGSDLLEVVKDLHEVILRVEGLSVGGPSVQVDYEVDRCGSWTPLGVVQAGPRAVLKFPETRIAALTVGTGSTWTTVELAAGSTTEDLRAGDWVRVRRAEDGKSEVRQVASVTDGDTFVLETALTDRPESGDAVFGARAAGREFRLRVTLRSVDRTASPRLTALAIRFQANVLDRWIHTLQVAVADGMQDLMDNAYGMDGASLRAVLDEWAQRVTPFVLEDPDGREFQVKVSAAGEGGWERKAGEDGQRYASTYSLNLIEV